MIDLSDKHDAEPCLKTKAEIARLRHVGERLMRIVFEAATYLHPGGSTRDAVPAVENGLSRLRAESLAELTSFPAILCASRNNVAAHGLPDDTIMDQGDIVTLDLAARIDGWCGDVAWTFPIGSPDPAQEGPRLRQAGWDACMAGVQECRPGRRVGDIASAMTKAAAKHGFQVIPDFAGHGIGKALHEAPAITPGGLPGMGARLVPGMVVTIEPVVVAGSAEVDVLNDGWTYVTADGSLAAQFEVMVYVHRDGFEVISYPHEWGPIAEALTSS